MIAVLVQVTPSELVHLYEVLAATNQYRREQDVIKEYYDINLEKVADIKETIRKRDLSTHFRIWYKTEYEGSVPPKAKKLYEYMEKNLKHKYSNGYIGLRFKKELADKEVMEESSALDD